MATGEDGARLTSLPFDIYRALAGFLGPPELARLCLVSRQMREVFLPMLWRSLRFRWPGRNKWDRYGGEKLLETDFHEHLVSLCMDMATRRSAQCSYPVSMRKKQRSAFIGRLRVAPKLSSLTLFQVFRRHFSKHPQWSSHLLGAVSGLRSLTLMGPAFQSASHVAGIIMASPNLRVLRVCRSLLGPRGIRRGMAISTWKFRMEESRMFWAMVLSILSLEGRDDEPHLRLEELAVDDFAAADFAKLTDLDHLRTLALVSPNAFTGDYWSPRLASLPDYVFPSAATLFHKAKRIRHLTVGHVTRKRVELIAQLRSANPRCLMELAVGELRDASSVLAIAEFPWRKLYLGPDTERHYHESLVEALGELDPLLEDLTVSMREAALEALCSRVAHMSGLRSLTIHLSSALDAKKKILASVVEPWAKRVLLKHEETMKTSRRECRLVEVNISLNVSYEFEADGPPYRGRRMLHTYFKSWDERLGEPISGEVATNGKVKDEFPAPGWLLGHFERRLERNMLGTYD